MTSPASPPSPVKYPPRSRWCGGGGESLVRRAENGFGQGRVLVSPFGMALVAATVAASGKVPDPVLIRGIPTRMALGPVAPMPREVADAVRAMMREAVTQGTAKTL